MDNHGEYQGGFFNSLFGQRGVLTTTEGHNYIVRDDDVWLYTGVTSVVERDASNVGFVLANMRTKEVRYYEVNGAEEYSAMSSAEGEVQEKGYTATFPLLNNVTNIPTYFLSLKDQAGLVKMYAFIDVENYQVVGVGPTVELAQQDYVKKIGQYYTGLNLLASDKTAQITGEIAVINQAVKEGNSFFYIRLAGSEDVFVGSITVSDALPVLQAGDKVTLHYYDMDQKTSKTFVQLETQ